MLLFLLSILITLSACQSVHGNFPSSYYTCKEAPKPSGKETMQREAIKLHEETRLAWLDCKAKLNSLKPK